MGSQPLTYSSSYTALVRLRLSYLDCKLLGDFPGSTFHMLHRVLGSHIYTNISLIIPCDPGVESESLGLCYRYFQQLRHLPGSHLMIQLMIGNSEYSYVTEGFRIIVFRVGVERVKRSGSSNWWGK